MKVRSSRPEMVFFMGLNFEMKTSMLPENFWMASSSVYPTYARGGCTKHADGTYIAARASAQGKGGVRRSESHIKVSAYVEASAALHSDCVSLGNTTLA